jgi:alkanesulfonate monooxygenase SsuD/methylene tetrahydromethanopterin reductase-like flavin-dependent oxidoreductase (luciferase family)
MAGPSRRIGPAIAQYRTRLVDEHGSPLGPVGVSRAVHVAASAEAALSEATDGLRWYIAQMRLLQPGVDSPPLEDVVRDFCILGSPEDCAAKIISLQAATGFTSLNCVFGLGGLAPSLTRRSMTQFAYEVLPILQARAGTTGA